MSGSVTRMMRGLAGLEGESLQSVDDCREGSTMPPSHQEQHETAVRFISFLAAVLT